MGAVVALTFVVSVALAAPIGVALGLAALAGILYVSPDLLVLLPQKFIEGVDSFPLLAIPLFILAGAIMGRGGVARRIVRVAMVFVGRMPAGLGMVNVVATMLFSGISGSSSADTAAIGSITLSGMREKGYPPAFATALIAGSGATACLIPPSIDFVIIGIVANISIGALFAAGFLPGAINALGIIGWVYYYGRKIRLPTESPMALREKLRALMEGIPALVMAAIIFGGIVGGVFTPTEASAVAVAYGLCISLFLYKELKLRDVPGLLVASAELSGVVLFVLGMASALSFVLTYERIPHLIGQYIAQHVDNWVLFVFLVNVLFLVIGCVTDALPALIVLMPILVPIGVSLGMNPVHLAVLVEANVGIGMITPPVGVCLFVACGLSRIPLESVLRPLMPFILVLVGTLLIISYVPWVTLVIPRILGYVGP